MNVTQHLAQHGVSFQEARDFVYANLNNPAHIFDVALTFGVTSSMLAELYGQGVNATVVEQFFDSQGLDGARLSATASNSWDHVDLAKLDWTDIENSFMKLSVLFRPLETSGPLSAKDLTAGILKQVTQQSFDNHMNPLFWDHDDDGIVTAEEAEAPGMPSFLATVDNVAAHELGFLVRGFTALDADEKRTLEGLISQGPGATLQQTQAVVQNYMDTLVQALLTPTSEPYYNNSEVANIIVTGMVSTIRDDGFSGAVLLSAVAPELFA